MKKYFIIVILISVNTMMAQSAFTTIADSLYVNGNYSKAIEAYQKNEDQSQVYDKIAKAYIAIGNYDAALLNYEQSIDANPNDALIKYEYAKLLAKTKKYQKASDEFYKLIDIDYRNPNYHYELGLVLEHLKDSTAQNRFYSAFQLDSTHQKAIYRIAKHQLKKGANRSVHRYVDIGLASYPNNKELISLKAQNYYVKKEFSNAVIWFEKLIALNEKSQFIYEKLRMSYANLYEFEKAIKFGMHALELEPTNANNLFIQAELYERIDDFKSAEKFMLLSLELQDLPLDKEYIDLASVYNRQEKYKEGIEMLKRAIRENPKNERAQFLLIYTKDTYYEDVDTRIKLYEVFLKKNPKSEYKAIVEYRMKELKEEKFLKTATKVDSIQKARKN